MQLVPLLHSLHLMSLGRQHEVPTVLMKLHVLLRRFFVLLKITGL